jgi:hypothetical protein
MHRLHFAGQSAPLAAPGAGQAFLSQWQDCAWVVYAKPPWGGPEQGLKYLSRSTPRVAIANSRLVFVGNAIVRFRYQDYAAGAMTKLMELRAEEFLRRFLLPVVPPGFVRIRPFGRVANRTRQEKLARCRQRLAVGAAAVTSGLPPQPLQLPTIMTEPAAPVHCPACGSGPLRRLAVVAPARGVPP